MSNKILYGPSYYSSKVVPTEDKISAVSVAADFTYAPRDDPDLVALHQVTGCFNSVVQIASTHCLHIFHKNVGLPMLLYQISPSALTEFLNSQQPPFESEQLNKLSMVIDQETYYAIRVLFSPHSLTFSDQQIVTVEYVLDFDIVTEGILIEPGGLGQIDQAMSQLQILAHIAELLEQLGIWPSFSPEGGDLLGLQARLNVNPQLGARYPSELPTDQIRQSAFLQSRERYARRAEYSTSSRAGLVEFLRATTDRFFDGEAPSEEPEWLRSIADLGSLVLSIQANYRYDAHRRSTSVDVYAELATAQINLEQPSGDLQRFYDSFLFEDFDFRVNSLVGSSRVSLTPTLSLVGRNPANITVDDISQFDVSVFHVDDTLRQAIVIAFSILPGTVGIVDGVEHFIGDQDYGVISDEYVVRKVFQHRWKNGGFYRRFQFEVPVVVMRNDGTSEDAILSGVQWLDTLDEVTIETNSNTRTDGVRLAGVSNVTAQYVRLGDGNVVGAEQVDIGDLQDKPWGVFTTIKIQPEYSDNAQLREFQWRAQKGVYQHIAKPFARFQSPNDIQQYGLSREPIPPAYIRTEGVTKQIFVLGNFVSTGAIDYMPIRGV
jgi:hypothetical protein